LDRFVVDHVQISDVTAYEPAAWSSAGATPGALFSLLTALGCGLLVAKMITEVTLFGASYAVQRGLVFGASGRAERSRVRHDVGHEGRGLQRTAPVPGAEPAAARTRAP
jgi:hypothetical protein